MKICELCGKSFPLTIIVDGKLRNISNRKYCTECTPFGTHNTRNLLTNKDSNKDSEKDIKLCAECGKKLKNHSSRFCSLKCSTDHRIRELIESWKSGIWSGVTEKGEISITIRKYVIESRNNKCEVCGFSGINPYTGRGILQVHHKDGNPENCSNDNLEVLCPNCHAMTENFGSRNKKSNHSRRNNKRRALYNTPISSNG